jgi:hypothetical protein
MRKTRQILGTAAVGALALLGASRAQAQVDIDFHGGAIACFYVGAIACNPLTDMSVPGVSETAAGTAGKIRFDTSTFVGTTVGGTMGLDNTSISCTPATTDNCGSFGNVHVTAGFSACGADTVCGNADDLDLHIALMLLFNSDYDTYFGNTPGTPDVSPVTNSTNIITGKVNASGASGVAINWDPNVVVFSFTNAGHSSTCHGSTPACGGGSYAGKATWTISTPTQVGRFQVGPSAGPPPCAFPICYGGTPFSHQGGAITGHIDIVSVSPEPGTVALFATGLVGLIPVVRYRRRKEQA